MLKQTQLPNFNISFQNSSCNGAFQKKINKLNHHDLQIVSLQWYWFVIVILFYLLWALFFKCMLYYFDKEHIEKISIWYQYSQSGNVIKNLFTYYTLLDPQRQNPTFFCVVYVL